MENNPPLPERLPNGMQFARFAIGDRPYCIWDWQLRERNLEFLDSVQPAHFGYLARAHSSDLEGEDRQLAAIALRTAYLHGLETFFALACSTIQAAHCIVGWVHLYRTDALLKLVRQISGYRGCHTILTLQHVTWETFATAVMSCTKMEDPEKAKAVQ